MQSEQQTQSEVREDPRRRLQTLLQTEDASLHEVAYWLRTDRVLTAQVMQTAARLRAPGLFPVTQLTHAINLLGFRRLLSLVSPPVPSIIPPPTRGRGAIG